jgi:hypothetical protein
MTAPLEHILAMPPLNALLVQLVLTMGMSVKQNALLVMLVFILLSRDKLLVWRVL